MPDERALPPGPKRALAAELFMHFRVANRPALKDIVATAAALPAPAPVSRETVRRLLTGKGHVTWPKVDAVFRALCRIANQDPDRQRWYNDGYDNDETTCREHLNKLWNDCLDGDDGVLPAPRSEPQAPANPPEQTGGWGASARQQTGGWGAASRSEDPWATSDASQKTVYSEEPPF
ncbi:hypothetical protein ACFV6F_13025 [Kitasatospora phosalacinea]|uniref:hypothetical protein n=1 Tax=Kitasatospora phosalacinea TaxID=2065 RepID=UPI0036516424